MVQEQIGIATRADERARLCSSWRGLRLLGVLAAVLAASGLLVCTAEMLQNRETRRQTRIRFQSIALGLKGYSDNVARIAFERSHPIPPTGLALEKVPWGEGRLPFPVRRATTRQPADDWYLRNGDGEPLYGWRVEILPFIESLPDSWQTSQPWDTAGKREMLKQYRFFSYESGSAGTALHARDQAFPDANAIAITGPGTPFGDGNEPPMSMKDLPPAAILVVEVRASGIPWPAPGDLHVRTMPQTINAPDGKGISSHDADGFHVIFGDRQVWFLSNQIPFESLSKFFTGAGAKKYDREKLLGPYALDRGV